MDVLSKADLLNGSVDQVIPAGERITILFMEDTSILLAHECAEGLVGLDIRPGHLVTTDLPLTVSPSILCPDCGLHGWVIKSTWEPA